MCGEIGLNWEAASLLHRGSWVNTETAVAHLIENNPSLVVALAIEQEQARLSMGKVGGFFRTTSPALRDTDGFGIFVMLTNIKRPYPI